MQLTKLGHSCVRIVADGKTLVIDPGIFSEDFALEGADAVLVTHEHPDHLDRDKLGAALSTNADLHVWTNRPLAEQLDTSYPGRVTAVRAGEQFDAAGCTVRAHGVDHAVIRDAIPIIANTGFLIDGVFHPGDAFTVPDEPIETLLLPLNAPWAKLSETVEQLAQVAPGRVHPVHDALLTPAGLSVYGGHAEQVSTESGATFHRLEPGDSVTL
ncbi:MAG: MBL fold metallo-hydrolase [Streptosporangiales bacterium]|nr:MBL fold metallo-hydrolase [Streptosporangiales bacterium]